MKIESELCLRQLILTTFMIVVVKLTFIRMTIWSSDFSVVFDLIITNRAINEIL